MYDKGEAKVICLLKLNSMNQEISNYLITKHKNDNISVISKKENFEIERNKMYSLLRENMKLKLEIALEKKLADYKLKNLDKIRENVEYMNQMIDNKQNSSLMDRNIDNMMNKLKMMHKEAKQFNL